MKEIDVDVLIVGSGLIGLLAAHCLAQLNYQVAIIDKKNFNNTRSSFKDTRTVAVSEGSKKFLQSLFLWEGLKNSAQPISNIRVYDRNPSNKILFQNPEKNEKLGYVIKNSIFIKYFLKELQNKKNVRMLYGEELRKIETEHHYSKTCLKNHIIKSKLIVAADGKNSQLRHIFGNKVFKKNYSESALVINFNHEKNLNNTAYEIFYNSGPLAILPMKSKNDFFQSSIIWSNKNAFVEKLINCNNKLIKNILHERIGGITGNIININSKQNFPLSAHINDTFYNKRLIYIGDSAHSVHPIAGQGWNLGVKDVKNLNFLFKKFAQNKKDIGNFVFCKRYNSLSYKNAFQLYQITDKLNTHFKNKTKLYRTVSNSGFYFLNNSNKIKNKITNFAMGY